MGFMRKLFQKGLYFEVNCKNVGEIMSVYRKGLDQAARMGYHEW